MSDDEAVATPTAAPAEDIKDFDEIIRQKNSGVGPKFKLVGLQWQCLPGIPAWKMALFTRSDADFMESFHFLRDLVIPEQRSALEEALKDDGVTTEILGDLISHLMEKFAGRPTTGA